MSTNLLTQSGKSPTVWAALSNEFGYITLAEVRGSSLLPYESNTFSQGCTMFVENTGVYYINSNPDAAVPIWNVISQGVPGPGVDSFNGRSGVVLPAFGDYDKTLVGLASVDNTADSIKPVSVPQQVALDLKLDKLMTGSGRVLGRGTAGAGNVEELTLGSNLSIVAGVLNSTDQFAGTVTTVSVATANGVSGVVTNPTTTPDITLTLGAITPTSVTATGIITGSNLTGINTGDQTITLTGDVTGSGVGSFAATIANLAVTTAKIANLAVDLTTKVTGILPATNGGSGFALYAVGDIIFANTTTAFAKLPLGLANKVLTSNGTTPEWRYTVASTSVAANYSMINTDDVIEVDSTAASRIITLLTSVPVGYKITLIKTQAANSMIIVSDGGYTLMDPYTAVPLSTITVADRYTALVYRKGAGTIWYLV